MEAMLMSLLSTDNNTRKQSEEAFEMGFSQEPFRTIESLLNCINSTQRGDIKEIGVVLLHTFVLKKDESMKKLNKDDLFKLISNIDELAKNNGSNIGENNNRLIIEIRSKMWMRSGQKELFIEDIVTKWKDGCVFSKESLLYSIEIFFEFSFTNDSNDGLLTELNKIVEEGFNDSSISIQMSSAMAFGSLFLAVKKTDKLEHLLPKTFELLVNVVKEGDKNRGIKVLGLVDDIIEFRPKQMGRHIESIIWILEQLIGTDQIDVSVRRAATVTLGTVIRNSPSKIKKSKTLKESLIPTLFKVIVSQKEEEIEEENNLSISNCCLELVEELRISIGTKIMLTSYIPYIQQALSSNEWRYQSAGLDVLGSLVEGSNEEFKDDINNLGKLVIPFLKNDKPIVVNSAIVCIKKLTIEFYPLIQNLFGEDLVDFLCKIVDETKIRNIKMNTISTFIELTQNSDDPDKKIDNSFRNLYPKILSTVSSLFEISLNCSDYQLLEELLSLLSNIAEEWGSGFISFYPGYMSGIIKLIKNIGSGDSTQNNKDNFESLLIETGGVLISSVLKESDQAKSDLQEVLLILGTKLNEVSEDSSIPKSILKFYASIIGKSEVNNQLVVDQAIDLALKLGPCKVDVFITDHENDPKKGNRYQSVNIDLKILGGKKTITIDHNALETKLQAISCIKGALKRNNNVISGQRIIACSDFLISEVTSRQTWSIKENAFKAISHLFRLLSIDDKIILFQKLMTHLITEIEAFYDSEKEEEFLSALSLSVKFLKRLSPVDINRVSKDNLLKLSNICSNTLNRSRKDKENLLSEYSNKLNDEENREMYLDEKEDLIEPERIVMNIFGELIVFDRENVFGLLNPALSYFLDIASNQNSVPMTLNEELYTLCFFSELLEKGSDLMFKEYISKALSFNERVISCHENEEDALQTSCFILGVCGYRLSPEEGSSIVPGMVNFLNSVLNKEDLIKRNCLECLENAVSALLKIFLKHNQILCQNSNIADVIDGFSTKLPFKKEKTENRTLANLVKEEYLKGNQFLRNDNSQDLSTKRL